jgi:hypothetical protein
MPLSLHISSSILIVTRLSYKNFLLFSPFFGEKREKDGRSKIENITGDTKKPKTQKTIRTRIEALPSVKAKAERLIFSLSHPHLGGERLISTHPTDRKPQTTDPIHIGSRGEK